MCNRAAVELGVNRPAIRNAPEFTPSERSGPPLLRRCEHREPQWGPRGDRFRPQRASSLLRREWGATPLARGELGRNLLRRRDLREFAFEGGPVRTDRDANYLHAG